jgi:diacylglycerol kinase (ATP)
MEFLMNNKPHYSIFKNGRYALEGFVHAFKRETSFKLELFFTMPLLIAIYLSPFALSAKMILLITLVLIMIVELLNSAIENVVDLVTKEIHPLAKAAKDVGATAVLFALLLHLACWVIILNDTYQLF